MSDMMPTPDLLDRITKQYRVQKTRVPLSGSDFAEAFRSNWELIVGGVTLGVTFAYLGHIPVSNKAGKFFLDILGYLGHGLIVSATAVLAFEWVSEAKRAQALTWALLQALAAQPRDKLENALWLLMGPSSERFKSLGSLTDHIAGLTKSKNWASDAFVRFLSESALESSDNARNLATLCRELEDPEPRETSFELVLRESAKKTDALLTSLLTSLPNGSFYDAVSNALIWRDLTDFQNSHTRAIRSGVNIRRVFVLFQPSDDLVPDNKAINTVYRHFKLSEEWGTGRGGASYEMRFIRDMKYKEVAPKLWRKLNFGVFVPPIAVGKPIAFDVREDNLSEFDVFIVDDSDPFVRDFNLLWDACGPTTDVTLRYALRAERMRRMKAGSYSAVSTFDNWADERLEQLDKDALEASTRGVEIRRIFVMDGNTNNEMLHVLRKHAESRRDHSRYDWLFCHRENLPSNLTKHLPIPYGIFEDRAPLGLQQVLHETYSGKDDQEFELADEVSNQIFNAFNSFWVILKKQEETVLVDRFGAAESKELMRR